MILFIFKRIVFCFYFLVKYRIFGFSDALDQADITMDIAIYVSPSIHNRESKLPVFQDEL